MKFQAAHQKVLEYLNKHGPVNTFRLSRELEMDRAQLINIVKGLTKNGLTEFKSGVVTKVEKGQKIKATIQPVSDTFQKPRIQKKGLSELKEAKKIKKEIKWLERDVSLKKREEAVKKREEAVSAEQRKLEEDKALLEKEQEGIIQKIAEAIGLEKEKEKIAIARKKLRKEKEQISKAKALKEDINKLEAILEDLKRKISIKKRKIKRLKEKAKSATSKPKIRKPIKKIGVSKPETEQSEIMPKELWQPATKIAEEKIEDKFHALIEQEISLLKQKRIDEARNIHLQIKDMISGVTDSDQRKIIIRDWNRIKDVYQ